MSGEPWIVTVTPTIGDGTVVRWFASEYAAERCRPTVSASRNRVCIDGDFGTDEERIKLMAVIESAHEAHRLLRRSRVDLSGLATHRSQFGGGLVPLEPSP